MGKRNYLVEGGSGTGKTAVCNELRRRGYHAINGDRELAYQGDPATGEPVEGITGVSVHDHHLWRTDRVRALAADHSEEITFFCGGSRNFGEFLDQFDLVFVLDVDLDTLARRLDERLDDEWGGKGRAEERDLILHLHRTRAGTPDGGILIDATAPLSRVVDEILRHVGSDSGAGEPSLAALS